MAFLCGHKREMQVNKLINWSKLILIQEAAHLSVLARLELVASTRCCPLSRRSSVLMQPLKGKSHSLLGFSPKLLTPILPTSPCFYRQ